MILKDLKRQFVDLISTVYELDECTALFDLTADRYLNISRLSYFQMQNNTVNEPLVHQALQVANELSTGKPLQYIFGDTVFYGLKFYVNSNVLIPRPETEELVHLIIQTVGKSTRITNNLLDIGTGTGCIPITLKKHLNNLEVSAIDVSPEALDVAIKNAELNEVNINFILADILTYTAEKKYDVIVSNPPYIKEDEKASMHHNVLTYEPHLALFVSNENPLLFYKAIAEFSRTNLNENGFLFFEINEYLGEQVRLMLAEKGFRNIQVLKDMQSKDRMVSCQYH
jgi:release factor glutamine methyltransferase